jgi:hypothetical protein
MSARRYLLLTLSLTGFAGCIRLTETSRTKDDAPSAVDPTVDPSVDPTVEPAAPVNTAMPVADCTESTSDELNAHIDQMATTGWPSLNRLNGIKMFGCPELAPGETFDPVTTPRGCFADAAFTEIATGAGEKDWKADAKAAGGLEFKMRMLRDTGLKTSYWARVSADGRFVGNGLPKDDAVTIDNQEFGAVVDDLASADRPRISIAAKYDSGFLPDNRGFTFHGAGNDVAAFCNQSLLANPATLTLDPLQHPAQCSVKSMPVYQHVGGSIDGSGYFVIVSRLQHFDDGGNDQRKDPGTNNYRTSTQQVIAYPMTADGEDFALDKEAKGFVPFEGDFVLSPTAQIFVGRVADKLVADKQNGYAIRSLSVSGAIAKTKTLATVCMKGGKADFSYDDRILAMHHYVAPEDFAHMGFASKDDAEFKKLVQNSSNIYVADLKTGKKIRVTNMKPGQFALYPSFRSDGWMYFLVRDMNQGGRTYIMATDAGLALRQ